MSHQQIIFALGDRWYLRFITSSIGILWNSGNILSIFSKYSSRSFLNWCFVSWDNQNFLTNQCHTLPVPCTNIMVISLYFWRKLCNSLRYPKFISSSVFFVAINDHQIFNNNILHQFIINHLFLASSLLSSLPRFLHIDHSLFWRYLWYLHIHRIHKIFHIIKV